MDRDDITTFIDDLDDASGFAAPATQVASISSQLITLRRDREVERWAALAVTALRDVMRDDVQPPVARALLQTPDAVRDLEAEPCEETSWFVSALRRTAASIPDVWVALAIPDSTPASSIGTWNPANGRMRGPITEMCWFIEVRGRDLGLPRGMMIRTGRAPLDHEPVTMDASDDAVVRRLGRRVLHGHPVRRR